MSWTAPSNNGGSAITGYTVNVYPDGASTPSQQLPAGASATSLNVTGLTNGTSYTFTVQATNSAGTGPESSPSAAVTPQPRRPLRVRRRGECGGGEQFGDGELDGAGNNGGSALTGYTITPYVGSTAQTPFPVSSGSATSAKVTGLTDGTAYTFTVTANNAIGSSQPSSPSSSVTPAARSSITPPRQTVDSGDSFGRDSGGCVQGRCDGVGDRRALLQGPANTGTHIGSLWTTSGTLLASATFTNETASGWQQVTFSSPVDVVPGTDYVVSYYAPNGHYSLTSSGLSSGVDNAPLHAIGNSTTPATACSPTAPAAPSPPPASTPPTTGSTRPSCLTPTRRRRRHPATCPRRPRRARPA